MTDQTLPPRDDSHNPEDYTGSLCWLLPKGEYTIIDAETIPLMERYRCTMGYHGRGRYPRVTATVNGRKGVFLHRLVMNAPAGLIVDHRNRDTRDQRRANLRLCTPLQNVANSGPYKKSASRFRGVHWYAKDGYWKVMATSPTGKRVYLGGFACEVAAARIYNLYTLDRHGEFAYQNPV